MSELDDVTDSSSPVVRYTAKELFARIDAKLDVVVELAQSKASQESVDALAGRISLLDTEVARFHDLPMQVEAAAGLAEKNDRRLNSLEDTRRGTTATWKLIAGASTATVGLLGAIAGVIALILAHV